MKQAKLTTGRAEEVLLHAGIRDSGPVDVETDAELGNTKHRPRRVQFVVDTRTGEFFEADDFLANEKDPIRHEELFQLRFENRKRLREGESLFVCPLCPSGPQPLVLSGRRTRHFFFNHTGGSEECDVKLSRLSHEQIRSIKYNGQQRGPLHEKLKEDIAKYLRAEVGLQGDVLIEKRVTDHSVSKDWRQPDLRATVNGTSYAFEIQVSTDFLDVVVGRTVFYARLGIRLIWVFPKFSGNLEDHRFAESDIFYKNNSNAFVYDLEAAERSNEEGRLFLKCRYRQYVVENGKLGAEWGIELVTLDQLRTSEDGEATFFHDTARNKAWCESIIAAEEQLAKAQKAERRRIAAEEAKRRALEVLMKFDPNNPADQALQYLRNLYSGDWERWNGYDPVNALTDEEHINRLNVKLAFDGEHVRVIGEAITDQSKSVFVRYIFHSPHIRIAVNRLVVGGTPVLQWCMQLESETEFRTTAAHLFRKGYRLTLDDKTYLTSQYAEASVGFGDRGRLFRWGYVKFLSKIGAERVSDLGHIEHELFAILSIKLGRVVGSGFSNLKEVVNTMFQYHSSHGSVFLQALYKYKQIDKLSKEDAKGTTGKKISAFVAFKPQQIIEYDSMFSAVFPELGTRQSWG